MRNALLVVLFLVLFCSTILFASHISNILAVRNFSDFGIYFRAAQAASDHMPIYDVQGMRNETFVHYKYPPLMAHLLKFLVPFGQKNMALVWFYLSIGFYITSLIIWIRTAPIAVVSSKTLLLVCMLFSSLPAVDSLSGTQMDCFMLMLLFICCWGILNDRPLVAGGSLAVLTMIKVFPVVLLIPFIQLRKYRFLTAFGLIFGVMLLISFNLAGVQEHKEFLFEVLPAHTVGSAYVENQSLFGFLARFFTNGSGWSEGRPADLPLVLWLSRIIGIAMLLITAYFIRFNRVEFGVAALVVWLLIALPVAWIHYQTLLFFPAALYLHHQFQDRINDTAGWFLLALAWACIAFGNQSLLHGAPVLLQSYKFFGVFILWVLYIRAMWDIKNN